MKKIKLSMFLLMCVVSNFCIAVETSSSVVVETTPSISTETSDSVVVETSPSVAVETSPSVVVEAAPSNLQWGVGFGLRYAGLGVNSEYWLNKRSSVHAGVGKSNGVNWIAGVNYYLKDRGEPTNYRVTANYGFVAAAKDDRSTRQYIDESFLGASVGVGVTKKHFEFTLMYRDLSAYDDKKKELESMYLDVDSLSSTTFSMGYLF